MNTLPESWKAGELEFSAFLADEAKVAQRIFNDNSGLRLKDPTFVRCELGEFESLIDMSDQPKDGFASGIFYLRKIQHLDEVIGYIQIETNIPAPGECWIPMLVLAAKTQGAGFGKSIVTSVVEQLMLVGKLNCVGLNVYAENARAFRFWVKAGFTHVAAVDVERYDDLDYTCVTLIRSF